MNNFAVIEAGGKQYRVSAGQKVKIETVHAEPGAQFVFDKVLLRAEGEKVWVGAPYLADAKAEGKIVREGRDRKKIVFKYHSKTRFRKKKGHRQPFTEVEIVRI